MTYVGFPPRKVVLRPSHLPSYMLLRLLILMLSFPWKSRTNDAWLIRHEKRSISPEDAAIFDSLESLDATLDISPASYDGPGPLHNSKLELSAAIIGSSYDHLLLPTTTSLDELMKDFDVESNSSNHPSNLSCWSETFWNSPLQRQDHDPRSTGKTENTRKTNFVEKIRCSKPFAPLYFSSSKTFHINQVASAIGSGSTAPARRITLGSCSESAEIESSQELLRNMNSRNPVVLEASRKHSDPSTSCESFSDQEDSAWIDPHFPLKRPHDFGSNTKDSPDFQKKGKTKGLERANASPDEMTSTQDPTLRKENITAKKKASRKEGASAHDTAQSNKYSKLQESMSIFHRSYKKDSDFLEEILHWEPKMRLSEIEKYIQIVFPQAKFTGMESFEKMKVSIKLALQAPKPILRPFSSSFVEKEGKGSILSDCDLWFEFLESYTRHYRPEMLRFATKLNKYARNKVIHHLYVLAGCQRFKKLGIYAEIKLSFLKMKPRLYEQARLSGVSSFLLENKVKHFLVVAEESTISMLYQIELLCRFNTPLFQNDELIHRDDLLEIMENLELLWKDFKPFEKETGDNLQAPVPEKFSFISPILVKSVHRLSKMRCGDWPTGMRISKSLLCHWLLDKNMEYFRFLKERVQSKIYGSFFLFLGDCAIHDLIHMIA